MRTLFSVGDVRPTQSLAEAYGAALEAGYTVAECYTAYGTALALESDRVDPRQANDALEKETKSWLNAVGDYAHAARAELMGCLRAIESVSASSPNTIDLPNHPLFWFGDTKEDLRRPTGLLDSLSTAIVFFNEQTGHQSGCFLDAYRAQVAAIKARQFDSVAYGIMVDWLERDRQYSPFAEDSGFKLVDPVMKNRITYATPYYPLATRIQVSLPRRTELTEATVLDYLQKVLVETGVSDKATGRRKGIVTLSEYSRKSHESVIRHALEMLEVCNHWQHFLPKSLVFDGIAEGQEALMVSNRLVYEYFRVYLKLLFDICNGICAVNKNILLATS